MNVITSDDAARITTSAHADVERARGALRAAAEVDWISDQADSYRRDLYSMLTALYDLEERISAARASLAALTPLEGLAA